MQCQIAQKCRVQLFACQLQTLQVNVGNVGMQVSLDVLVGESSGTIQL